MVAAMTHESTTQHVAFPAISLACTEVSLSVFYVTMSNSGELVCDWTTAVFTFRPLDWNEG
uniref:Uncharacterized protein n=1 Tax=Anguilla anguilla TaxID=7936 RepID=A0A0E9WAQ0_ANGAN